MMRSCILIVPLTFIVQAQAKEQDSMDKLADDVLGKLVDELSNRMYDSLHDHAGLESTVLGKPGVATIPTSRQSPLYAIPDRSASVNAAAQAGVRPPPVAPLPPSRRFDPFKGANKELINGVPEEYQAVAKSLTKQETWEAMERASAAMASPPKNEELPYSINFFVHGGNLGPSGKLGIENEQYLESRIASALKNYQGKIEAVDVRLNIEGHDPKTYRLEVTVKTWKKGKVVLSNPANAEHSFIEAVDSMHDTLKSAVRKEKEKLIAKKRHAQRSAGIEDMPDEAESETQGGSEHKQVFDGAGDSPY